jgi:4-diphosphocytidyl-2-C-methyl-D-erythritol kinase
MSPQLTRMRGIGDQLEMLGPPPQFPIILVNPRQGVSTPAVFNALASKENPPVLEAMPDPRNREAWLLWLSKQRNDLEVPAQNLVPVIGDVLAALRAAPGVALARMSGSGATCFALMQNDAARDALAAKLAQTHPDWWIASTQICLDRFK